MRKPDTPLNKYVNNLNAWGKHLRSRRRSKSQKSDAQMYHGSLRQQVRQYLKKEVWKDE